MSSLNRVVVVGVTLIAASASAGVNFTSRVSTVLSSRDYFGSYEPAAGLWYETDTYNALGAYDVTLPHGFQHSSTVTNSGVSGGFFGSKNEGSSNNLRNVRETSLVANFTVTGSVDATIKLNGSCDANRPPSVPEMANAYFVIYNADTNAIVFNSWTHSVYSTDPNSFAGKRSWTNVTRVVGLSAGNYRLTSGAAGNDLWYYGFGQGSTGSGGLTALMTFADVPAPGGCAAMLGAGLLAARRRRI